MTQFIYTLLGGSATFVLVLLYLFKHPEKFEHWMAIFYKLALGASSGFPLLKAKFDRRAVASSIQDCVNGIGVRIEKQAPGVLPHALKIEWAETDTPESFIKKGRAVVRLRHFYNQDKNIVDSTLLYLKVALLPRAKNYLDPSLRKVVEFRLASQIFVARRDTGAYDYFFEKELTPAISSEPTLEADLQLLEHLDSVGFFMQVFLCEIRQAADRLLGAIPTQAIQRELRDFALFLQTIATKGGDEIVPLQFSGAKVRVGVVLVARKETIHKFGIAPYINAVRHNVNHGFDSVYLTAWGKEFVQKVLQIKSEIDPTYVNVLRRYDFVVRSSVSAILLVCQSNTSQISRQKELEQQVRDAMLSIVPELKDGELEITGVARMQGTGCKISVRPLAGQDAFDATGACIGEKAERVNKLKEALGNEFVGILAWSESPQEYIANALKPLKESAIHSIELDEPQLVATVKLSSEEALYKALGKDGINLKLASQLTGWHIILQGPESITDDKSPEEDFADICSRFIPEFKSGEIQFVRMARIRGIATRAIVKWNSPVGRRILASQVCLGSSSLTLHHIQDELGERVYFHEWYDDPKDLIVSCLYPIKRSSVQSIALDQSTNTATISLKPSQDNRPVYLDQYGIALAERVTGWRLDISANT
jgi:transcription antitermination factor NusA-like protein